MARKRMISPGFWTDEKLGACSRDERLLFMGLISNADDEGRLPGHPAMIKAMVFPYDEDIRFADIGRWLQNLAAKGFIKVYKVGEQQYIWVKNFRKHQFIQKPTTSVLPSPDQGEDTFAPEDKKEKQENDEKDKETIEIESKEKKEKTEDLPALPDYTETERQILGELKAVPGYPFNFEQDLDYIRTLATEFPTVDLLAEAKKWRTYKRDKPLGKKSNPRLQFRNWLEKAAQWQQEKGAKQDGERGKHSGTTSGQKIDLSEFFYRETGEET